jgi:hypothetical protein
MYQPQQYSNLKHFYMGLVHADIELINGDDLALVRRGYMDINEVKKMHVNFLAGSAGSNRKSRTS